MKRLAIVLALLLAAACDRPAEKPVAATRKTTSAPLLDSTPKLENGNLGNLVFGASVIGRNIEQSYENSVAHALDGTSRTSWASVGDEPLEGIFSLAAPTRIRRLGITTPRVASNAAATLHIETSPDGRNWAPTLDKTFTLDTSEPWLFDVQPVVARYLRVTFQSGVLASIDSLQVIGDETAPVVQPRIEGCWEINNEPARFVQKDARVSGTIGPMVVDGGSDGRVYRLMWLEKMMFGYAVVTVSPDGNHLAGLRWHEEVNPAHAGDGWIGHRMHCVAQTLLSAQTGVSALQDRKIVDALLGRANVWRLYGVRFDRQDRILGPESAAALDLAAQLIREKPRQRFRIVAREFRAPTVAKNRARCDVKLAAMREALRARGIDVSRVDFVNAGIERSPLNTDFTSNRAMDSGVELQGVPPR